MSEMFIVKKDKNWDKLRVALTRTFSKNINKEVGIELIAGAQRIRNRIILSMRSTPKTGKIYTRKSVKHIASSPGNPPAIDQSDLVGRIIVSSRLAQGEVEVGAGKTSTKGKSLLYAKPLEFGAARVNAGGVRSILFPRPFIEPAANAELPGIQAGISRAVFFKGIQDTLK